MRTLILAAPAPQPGQTPEQQRLAELERENRKLSRINKVLMDRVERSMDFQGSAFSLFQTAIVLETKVRERTLELERTLHELERSNRDLARAKEMAETVQARLAEAIESVNEGFALFDGDDRLVMCNSKYLAVWPSFDDRIRPGISFAEIAELALDTRSLQDGLSQESDRDGGRGWLAERMSQHRNPQGPYVLALADGRWMQVNERRTRDGGVVGVYTDITDLKRDETRRREQELAEKSVLLQATLDNIAQGVAVYDRDLNLVAWNDNFAHLLDLPGDVVRHGATYDDFVRHNAGLGAAGLSVMAMSREDLAERPLALEEEWQGRVLDIRRTVMPGGGFVNTYTDITERKRNEEALRDSERRIRTITDAMPALIAYVDAEQRFRFVNKPYEDWFNRPREEIDGQPMWDALGRDHYEQRRPNVLAALAGEEVTFEMELPGENGAVRYALATYIPHFDENGVVLGYFALIQDITERRMVAEALKESKESLERRVDERTAALMSLNGKLHQEIAERKQIEEALRVATAEAEQANLSKTKFLAAASHDLLQPLNAARLFISALSDLEQTPQNGSLIANTDVALAAVEDLLGALLDISKLDAGVVQAEPADYPIESLLGAMSTEYAAQAKERGLEFRVVSSSAVVHSDIRLLRRILQNFLSNATRYTRTGRVLLGCRLAEGGLRIEVWDTGPGIPEDKLAEIFEEFRRLGNDQSGRDRGMGLGLAIVERVARMLDHRIGVRSIPGKGSVFSVTVPMGERGRLVRPPQPAPVAITNRLAGSLVLVIDNERSILSGMTALLEGWRCTVVTATTGQEAIDILERMERAPDLAIADYHLEDGAIGVAELRRVAGHCGHAIPSLIITANRLPEVQEEVNASGFHLLNKPVKPAHLRSLMTSLLG
ncbi:NahK/ErcS family hybrid sensor histidine kinase/response regulator [Skermanella stibiiresistens]|uniref:NahK/ErcS family hybrid sensor histidine kinase/response regulator n=1 Tax=Skermanella stibiiresistens TaxID=913326 RepID=UPI0004AFD894|nr:NahK/ErcS family hybrid sensor histidine kinase/response regulator [Skermanella stibiiresistens]